MASGTILSADDLNALILELPAWKLEDGQLVRTWTFKDFAEAVAFVDHVAQLAEQANHHPDIDIRYNRVRLAFMSHDAGGITARDVRIARSIADI